MMKIPDILERISTVLSTYDAKAIVVGGSVRDHILGLEIKDYDIEVYGLETVDILVKILSQFGKVKLVGKSFGVLKFVHEAKEYDFAFPRREHKSGTGHKGFTVESDGFMSYKEAAKRRDFTINAMGYEIATQTFYDPYGGKTDIALGILRHIDNKTFIEDPLRLYRGVQFAARFGFSVAEETKILCKKMAASGELDTLAMERIFDELKKLFLKSKEPSIGMKLIKELNALYQFPELLSLNTKEWEHVLSSLDRMAGNRFDDIKKDINFMFAVLSLHFDQVRIERFIGRLTPETGIVSFATSYVRHAKALATMPSDREIRELSIDVVIQDFCRFLSVIGTSRSLIESLEKRAHVLGIYKQAFMPLLQGKDLISLELQPSKRFSLILNDVFNKQLDGEITNKEDALTWVKNRLKEGQWQ